MKSAVHWIKFIIKCLLILLFLPFIALWAYLKCMLHRIVLVRNMKKYGMPRREAKRLSKEFSPLKIFNSSAD